MMMVIAMNGDVVADEDDNFIQVGNDGDEDDNINGGGF